VLRRRFERLRDGLPAWRDRDSEGDGVTDGTSAGSVRLGVDADSDGFVDWADQDDTDPCIPVLPGPC